MDVDEHLLWLICALKSAQDSDGVKKEKIIQNVNNCFLRVKKEKRALNIPASQSSEELQNFQVKATVFLLLCLPKIRELPNVENCGDFQSLISSLPELSESIFFTVVRTQKIYFYLSPLLSWLPPHTVQALTREYFRYTDEVTPLTLTVSVELLKALLFSSQQRRTNHENYMSDIECLELVVKFFTSRSVSGETPAMVKFSGYFFMYMCECLYLLLAAYVGNKMRDPDTFSCIEVWTKLWKTAIFCSKNISLSYTKEVIKSMLMLCQNNNREVAVDMWMEWSELMLPQTVIVHPNSSLQLGKGQTKSIQLVICNIAFDVLRILEGHPQLEKTLSTSECHELLQFFHQVATDPDYDPDQDLTLEQLIQEINHKDDRQEKLLGFLIQNDGVFTSDDACSCLREHRAALDNQLRLQLLQHCIEWIKADKPCNLELKNVVLDLATNLSPEQLKILIECSLSAGLDDTLKMPSFRTQLTAVFNQMADENSSESLGKHVWLCLQSGRGVVEQAVRQAITMTGLVPVMVQALADLLQVCRAVLPSGNSLLVSTLVEWQTSELHGREKQEFITLVKNLLSVRGMLDAQEVMQLMVEPFLVMECNRGLKKFILPIEILKEVMTQDVHVVVRPGPVVVSLTLALTHVMGATVCLDDQGASVLFTLRSLVSSVLLMITETMADNQKKYEREINLLKQMVGQYHLHPWSIIPLSKVLDAEVSGESGADLLLHALIKVFPSLIQGGPPDPVTTAAAVCSQLQRMSKSEWIIALLQLLPQCSESEWRAAFFLTDYVLGSWPAMFAVLEVFQGVVHLVCESLASPPCHLQEAHSPPLPVSLHHFFTFFASAFMIYLEEKSKAQDPKERFLNFTFVFRWWCCTVPSFCCNPELPTLLLARLCGALEEMVISGRLKVLPEREREAGIYCDAASVYVNEGEAEYLLEKYVNIQVRQEVENEKQHQETDVQVRMKEENEKRHERSVSAKERERSPVPSSITKKDLKRELEQMTLFMVKYVPSSNLLASIASKFKKLYEA